MACYKLRRKDTNEIIVDEDGIALQFNTLEEAQAAVKGFNTVLNEVERSDIDFTDIEKKKIADKFTIQSPFNTTEDNKAYTSINSPVDYNTLKSFWLHDYVYTTAFADLVLGDTNISHKDFVDVVKRNGTQVSDGPSTGFGRTKFAVVRSTIRTVDGIQLDVEDGQTWSSPMWYLDKYLTSQAKKNPRVIEIYQNKILVGLKLNNEEIAILKNNNALLTDRKLLGRDHYRINKTSFHTISRESSSTIINPKVNVPLLQNAWKRAIAALDNNNYEEYQNIVRNDILPKYEPLPNRLHRHTLLNHMILHNYGYIVVDSAAKGMRNIVGQYNKTDNTIQTSPDYMSDYMLVENLKTDNEVENIVDGTQKQGLIYDEQDDQLVVNLTNNGVTKTVQLKDLLTLYDNVKQKRTVKKTDSLYKKMFKPDGTVRWENIQKLILQQSHKAQVDANIAELFDLDADGNPIISYSNTLISKDLENALLNALSKVVKDRVNGATYTLISSNNVNIMEYEGKILPTEKYIAAKNSIDKTKITTRKLKYGVLDSTKNVYYAEVIVSEDTLKKLGVTVGSTLQANQEMLFGLGVRIPTEDKHSMVVFKIVDTLPNHYTKTIMLPDEVILYSGADFDIDKLFAQHYNFTKTGKIKYGTYLKQSNTTDALQFAFYEYLSSTTNKKVRKFREQRESLISITRNEPNLSPALAKLIEQLDAIDTNTSNKLQNYDNTLLQREINQEIDKHITTQIFANQYESEYFDFIRNYSDQVKANVEAFRNKNFNAIESITAEEDTNLLLDLEMVFAYNEKSKERATYPNSLVIWKDPDNGLIAMLQNAGFNLSKEKVQSITNIVDRGIMQNNIDVGGDNIGVVATFNIMYRLFKNYDTHNVRMFGKKRGFKGNDTTNIYTTAFHTARLTDEKGKIRTSALVATLINMMTDNAKEQLAKEINLDKNNLSDLLVGIGLGIDLKFLMVKSLYNKPFTQVADEAVESGELELEDSQLETLLENIATGINYKILQKENPELTAKYKEKMIAANKFIKDSFVNTSVGFSLISELYKNPSQEINVNGLTRDEVLVILRQLDTQYNKKVEKIRQDLLKLNDIRSLVKGVSSDIEDLSKVYSALDYFKISLNTKKVSEPTNLDKHYFVKKGKYYYRPEIDNPEAVEYSLDAQETINGFPNPKYELAKIIINNKEIQSRLLSTVVTDAELLSRAMLKNNPIVKRLFELETKRDANGRASVYGYNISKARLKGFYNNFVTKLTSIVYNKALQEEIQTNPELKAVTEALDNYSLFYSKLSITLPERLKTRLSEEGSPYKNNKFLLSTFFKQTTSKVLDKGFNLNILSTDTFSEILPDFKNQISNDFAELAYAMNKINMPLSELVNTPVEQLTYDQAAALMSLVSQATSLQAYAHGYKRFSISTVLPSKFMVKYFKQLNTIEEVFVKYKNDEKQFKKAFKEVTGLELSEFMDDFFLTQGLQAGVLFDASKFNRSLKREGEFISAEAYEEGLDEFDMQGAGPKKTDELSKYGFTTFGGYTANFEYQAKDGTTKTFNAVYKTSIHLDTLRLDKLNPDDAMIVRQAIKQINQRPMLSSNDISYPQVIALDKTKHVLQRVVRTEGDRIYQYLRDFNTGVIVRREFSKFEYEDDNYNAAVVPDSAVEVDSMPSTGTLGVYVIEGAVPVIDTSLSSTFYTFKEMRTKIQKLKDSFNTEPDKPQLLSPIEFINKVNRIYYRGINQVNMSEVVNMISNYNAALGYNAVEIVNDNGIYRLDTDFNSQPSTYTASDSLISILNKLSQKFGIPYEIDTKMPYKGKYYNGKVYINPTLVTDDTAYHEFAHPFIATVKTLNRSLYNNLAAQIRKEGKILERTDKLYRKFFERKKMSPAQVNQAILEEAIVQAIGEYAANNAELVRKSPKLAALIKQFLDYIKKTISQLYNKDSINVDEIPTNTTLQELAVLFTSDIDITATVNREVLDVLNQIDKCL